MSSFLNENRFICEKGKIYPFGFFHTLKKSVLENPNKNHSLLGSEGLLAWSKELELYGTDNFFAVIDQTQQSVAVFKRQFLRNKKIAAIPFPSFQSVKAGEYIVGPSGFLHLEKVLYVYDNALLRAANGENPDRYSDDEFIEVGKQYRDQKMVVIRGAGSAILAVYNTCGKRMEFKTSHPLSRGKWNRTTTVSPITTFVRTPQSRH